MSPAVAEADIALLAAAAKSAARSVINPELHEYRGEKEELWPFWPPQPPQHSFFYLVMALFCLYPALNTGPDGLSSGP